MIRTVSDTDAPVITEIYNHYITHSTVTFEITPLTVSEMRSRISRIKAEFPYLVYEEKGRITGYCYVHRWHERAAADGVMELSVYLSPDAIGHGVGKALMNKMIDECRRRHYRIILSSITGENKASRALHLKLGFEQVGHFKNVGIKFGRPIDIIWYELSITK